MQDLIYFGYTWDEDSSNLETSFIEEIKEAFPQVKLVDAFDDIKGFRQEVHLPEEEKDNYLAWLMGNGWWNLSLTMQLIKMGNISEFKRLFELTKKQYPKSFINEH